MEKQAKHS